LGNPWGLISHIRLDADRCLFLPGTKEHPTEPRVYSSPTTVHSCWVTLWSLNETALIGWMSVKYAPKAPSGAIGAVQDRVLFWDGVGNWIPWKSPKVALPLPYPLYFTFLVCIGITEVAALRPARDFAVPDAGG
jgi:hypothetical protein